MSVHDSDFLLGAARQVQTALSAGAVSDDMQAAALRRTVEALTRLAAQWRLGEEIIQPLAREQALLLHEVGERMRTLGLTPPAGACGPEAGYQALRMATADGLRDVGRTPHVQAFMDLFAQAMRLETIAREGMTAAAQQRLAERPAQDTPLDELQRKPPTAEALSALLSARIAGAKDVVVSDIRQLRAANSKDIIFFKVAGVPGWPERVVMRRLRGFSVNEKASLPYEFQLLGALRAAGMDVPRPLLVEDASPEFGQPFMIMEQLSGQARTRIELGDSAPAVIRQMAERLGQIHSLAAQAYGRNDWPGAGARDRLLPFLEEYYVKWTKLQQGPDQTLEYAFAWLRENVARVDDTLVLVHGDYDLRNLLVEDGQISAVLDWERSHMGHPAEDIIYCVNDVTPVMDWEEFLALYRQAGGHHVRQETLDYFDVWTAMTRVVGSTQVRDAYQLGVHQDFITGSFGVIELPVFQDRLAQLMAKVAG